MLKNASFHHCRLEPIYSLTDDNVATISPTGGTCETKFATATSYSLDDYKREIAAAISVDIASTTYSLHLSG